jgi:hypothetical protein
MASTGRILHEFKELNIHSFINFSLNKAIFGLLVRLLQQTPEQRI